MDNNQNPIATRITAKLTGEQFKTTPGNPVIIPIMLTNLGQQNEYSWIELVGIPTEWVDKSQLSFLLNPEEHVSIDLRITPPATPGSSIGHYPLQIKVFRSGYNMPEAILQANLTVAVYEVEGRIGILLEAVKFSIAPGGTKDVNFLITNQGLVEDTLRLSVKGIPNTWISTTSPSIRVMPGEKRLVTLKLNPPQTSEAKAGRTSFVIQLKSQQDPVMIIEVNCELTIEVFSDFHSEMKPKRLNNGETLHVLVENHGNIPETYQLNFTCENNSIDFYRVVETQNSGSSKEKLVDLAQDNGYKLRVDPGASTTVNFNLKANKRPWVGKDAIIPFSLSVNKKGSNEQMHLGELIAPAIIPIWVFLVGFLVILILSCSFIWSFIQSSSAYHKATQTAEYLISGIVNATQTNIAQSNAIVASTATASVNMTQAALQGKQDDDGDGLTNDQELAYGTDSKNPDTEQDGLKDGDEVMRWRTDPLKPDTDQDGLKDGDEVNLYRTDPLKADTDGDGLSDSDEVGRRTDPNNQDTDKDGLRDGDELLIGTDPLNPDSDKDGLMDGQELKPCPDPLNPDSDKDGILDGKDLDPCDSWNPSITQTAIAGKPTSIPPSATSPVSTPIPQLYGFLAFESNRDGANDLYTLNLVNMFPIRLTLSAGNNLHPSWSPDGRKIAFTTNRDGQYEIYVMNSDGSGLVNLTNHPSDDINPAWSPDGFSIAFASLRDGQYEIYVMNTDGSQPRNLTNNPAEDNQPAWINSNTRLAFSQTRVLFTSNRDGQQEIYSVNLDGTQPLNLTNNPANDYLSAGSPDAQSILFTSVRNGNPDIWIMGADGSSQRALTNTTGEDAYPTWSPLMDWVAFASNRDGNWEIYIMRPDGSGQFNLTNNPAQDQTPSWW
jgi:Tol biopolymer transport system component